MNELNSQRERHGYWEDNYSGGNLSYRGNFINGKEHGYWEYYHTDKKLMGKGTYNNGVRCGHFEWGECFKEDYGFFTI